MLTVDAETAGNTSWTQSYLYHGTHFAGQVCFKLPYNNHNQILLTLFSSAILNK